jgi:hypothetical protein
MDDIKRLKRMDRHQHYTGNHRGALKIKDLIGWVKQGFVTKHPAYRNRLDRDEPLGLTGTPVEGR